MILEGIVSSLNDSGVVNIAPMGPYVELPIESLRLRPFKSTQTFQNLKTQGQGVFHVVDDVLLMARAAIGELKELPTLFPAEKIQGQVIDSTCRWYEFQVVSIDESQDRADIMAKVVHVGHRHDFFGFNRAKHAVIEAAIFATRVHLMSRDQIKFEFDRLQSPVQKTAGPKEIEAFALLKEFVNRR